MPKFRKVIAGGEDTMRELQARIELQNEARGKCAVPNCEREQCRWHNAPTDPVPSAHLSDTRALDLIRAELSGVIWTPDTLDVIAAYVKGTGREVLPPADDEPQFTTDVAEVRVQGNAPDVEHHPAYRLPRPQGFGQFGGAAAL